MTRPRRPGFTLLEVLVALAVLTVLAAAVYAFTFHLLDARTRIRERALRQSGATAFFDRLEHDLQTCVVTGRAGAAGIVGSERELTIESRGVDVAAPASRRATLMAVTFRHDPASAQVRAVIGGDEETAALGSVRRLRLRFHDGSSWQSAFDSARAGTLPVLVEAAIWFGEPLATEAAADDRTDDQTDDRAGDRIGGPATAAGADALPEAALARGSAPDPELDSRPPDAVRVIAVPDAAWLTASLAATGGPDPEAAP